MTENSPKSFADQRRDAALALVQEQSAERRRVEATVLGTNDAPRDRIGGLVPVNGDYVVEVVRSGERPIWTTVVGGERGFEHFRTVDEALLHLIARRHGNKEASGAAFYAARVLGIPTEE